MKNITRNTFRQFKVLEYMAYFTVVIIPLIILKGHLFPYTSIKSFLTLGIVCMMAILYIWGKNSEIKSRQGSVHITWVHVALLFFAVALGISAIFGLHPSTSWFGTFLQGTGLVYIYSFIIFGLFVGILVRRRQEFLETFIQYIFVSGSIVALISWFKENSTIGNTSFLGSYLLFIAMIGIALCITGRNIGQKIVAVIGTLIILFSPSFFNNAILKGNLSLSKIIEDPLLLIGSANGAGLGLFVTIIVMLGLFATLSKQKIIKWIGIVFCAAIAVLIFFVGHQLMTDKTFIREKFIEQKTASRFVYWDIAQKGWIDRPITGYGWGNYDTVYQKHFDPVVFAPDYATEPSVMDPHNLVFTYASTTGILGLVSYLLLLIVVFITLYSMAKKDNQQYKIITIILGSSLVGYVIQNMFIFDTPVTYLILFSIIGITVGLAPVRWTISFDKKYNLFYKIEAVFVTAVSMVCIVLFTILPLRESIAWQQRITNTRYFASKSPQVISWVGDANDTSFIAIKFFMQTKTNTEISKEYVLKTWALLISDLEHDIKQYPDNYKPYLVKGILENGIISISKKSNLELTNAARTSLEQAIKLNPRTPEAYFHLAQTATYEQNFQDTYDNIRKGIEIAAYYPSGYNLATALLKIIPNKEFEIYIAEMKKMWNIQI